MTELLCLYLADVTMYQYQSIPAKGIMVCFYADGFCYPHVVANNVGGKTLLNLNRDLNGLFPGDFLSRKELWDIILNLVSSKYFVES